MFELLAYSLLGNHRRSSWDGRCDPSTSSKSQAYGTSCCSVKSNCCGSDNVTCNSGEIADGTSFQVNNFLKCLPFCTGSILASKRLRTRGCTLCMFFIILGSRSSVIL